MRALTMLCMAIPLSGCARQETPKPPIAPVASTAFNSAGGTNTLYQPGASQPILYEGRTAQEWGNELQGRDAGSRAEAVQALGELGEDGYRFLVQGMQHATPDMRLMSLQALYQPVLLAHGDEMKPLLVQMLRDADPRIRQGAAVRLACFGTGAKGSSTVLRKLSTSDPDRSVRLAALESAMIVEGVKPVYSEDLK